MGYTEKGWGIEREYKLVILNFNYILILILRYVFKLLLFLILARILRILSVFLGFIFK